MMRVATLFSKAKLAAWTGGISGRFRANGAHTTQFHYKYPTHAQFHTNARHTRSFTTNARHTRSFTAAQPAAAPSPILVGWSPSPFLVNAAEDLVGRRRSLLLHGSRGRRGAWRRPGEVGPGCRRDE